MKLSRFSFVCDENIHPTVIDYLKTKVKLVKNISELGLASASDEKILAEAHSSASVVVTHDSDFGKIVFLKKVPFTGIVYLRPGHIIPVFTIDTLKSLFENELELRSPFMLVAERH